jgi:hypothetical protein
MRSLCCGLLTIASLPALAGEKTACQTRPPIDDGREWHYRTQIPGGPKGDDRCFYAGSRMKARSELYWSVPELPSPAPVIASEPEPETAPAPVIIPSRFDEVWGAMGLQR